MVERTDEEILEKIQKLADMSVFIPDRVDDDERELYRWFCRGGISALRWALGEEMGDPPHETDILFGEGP